MIMKYFIFDICWSITDVDTIIVIADTKEQAESELRKSPLNPNHFDYRGEAGLGILNKKKLLSL